MDRAALFGVVDRQAQPERLTKRCPGQDRRTKLFRKLVSRTEPEEDPPVAIGDRVHIRLVPERVAVVGGGPTR